MSWNNWINETFKGLVVKPSEKLISIKSYSKNGIHLFFKTDEKFNLIEVSLATHDSWNGFYIVMDHEKENQIDIEQDYLFASLDRVNYSFNKENLNMVTRFLETVLQGWKESVTYYKGAEVDITFEFKNGLKYSKNIYPLEELDIPLLGKVPFKLENWYLKTFRSSKLQTKEFSIEGFPGWTD